MKYVTLLVTLFVTTLVSQGQTPIKLEDVSRHIGDSVQVCGKIYSGRWLRASDGRPILLNMGALYPNQPLTVVVWGKDRMRFDYEPELELIEREVCLTGRIQLHNGKPQLVLYNPKQVVIKDDDVVIEE